MNCVKLAADQSRTSANSLLQPTECEHSAIEQGRGLEEYCERYNVGMSLEYEVGISPLNNSTVGFTFTETDNKKVETPDFHHLVILGE